MGATTFNISVSESPEQLSYVKTTADISYTTKSYAAEGGVGSLKLSFGGANYKKLPEFVSIASTNGINADIIPVSETVGRINEFTINDQGFDFSNFDNPQLNTWNERPMGASMPVTTYQWFSFRKTGSNDGAR